jgi:lantibiotic modifying enzyme
LASEQLINQRVRELQLFLDDLITHPLLKNSFEVKSFLECSPTGFKAFLQLYNNKNNSNTFFNKNSIIINQQRWREVQQGRNK